MKNSATQYSDGNKESVTGNLDFWQRYTVRAAQDDMEFMRFRRADAMLKVVEGSPRTSGIWNLRRLMRSEKFRNCLPLLQATESIGLPLNLIDFTVNNNVYSLNPTTLRYANNILNYLELFGEEILDGTPIYEIGGGYGGECKVFNDFASTIYSRNLSECYHIFDLQSSYALTSKYLSYFKYSTAFLELDRMPPIDSARKGLVISNGAISEMRGGLLNDYIDKVIQPCTHGYFMTNFESHSLPFGGMSTHQFLSRLREIGKVDAVELNATKYLSFFDWQAGTKLIVFGAKQLADFSPSAIDALFIRLLHKLIRLNEWSTKKFIDRS